MSRLRRSAALATIVAVVVFQLVIPAAQSVTDVCLGFAQNVFIDGNGNDGIADSNGVQSTPWINAVTDFSASEYDFEVPLEASVQQITILPTADNTGDADVAIECPAGSGTVVTATATASFVNVVAPETSGLVSPFSQERETSLSPILNATI